MRPEQVGFLVDDSRPVVFTDVVEFADDEFRDAVGGEPSPVDSDDVLSGSQSVENVTAHLATSPHGHDGRYARTE